MNTEDLQLPNALLVCFPTPLGRPLGAQFRYLIARPRRFCRNWCTPILNSIINSSRELKNRGIGMIPCWFDSFSIPNRIRQRFRRYLIGNQCNKLVEVKTMWGTMILSKSMYPNTKFDYEYGWTTEKFTDANNSMLVPKVFVHGLIKTKIPPIS